MEGLKVTLGTLWNARIAFGELTKNKFKAKVSYKLMKMIEQINSEMLPFGRAQQELYEKYGEKQGEMLIIPEDKKKDFDSEMIELEAQEIELKFRLSLDEIENADLTPAQVKSLEFMFTEEIAAPQ